MNLKIGLMVLLTVLLISSSSALVIDSVSTTPGEIGPGDVSVVEIGIENNREDDVKDVSVALDLREIPFAPHQTSSEFNFDEIKDGKIKYATFKIKALNDAQSGIYKIPVKVTFEEEGEIKERDSLISITVNSKPIIDAGLEEVLLLKGQESEVAVRIVNKGLSDIKFLEVETEKSTYYSILSPENVYIGDLDSDDFDSGEFKIFFKENSPTNLRIPVTIRYRDVLNEEFQETINLEAKIYSREQAVQLGLIQQNNTVSYVIIVVVLIVIYLIYRRIRKYYRRKREREE